MNKSLPLLLLVDDAPDIALIVRHLGERVGYALHHCEDGETAWAYLVGAGQLPDLVVLDIHLPRRDGAYWCRQLRGVAWGERLPLALFSQGGQSAVLAEGLDAGADFFLAKDLLGNPAAWQTRLGEVLTGVGRPPPLGRRGELTLSPAAWPNALSRALRLPALQQLGPEVIGALLRRAARRIDPPLAPAWLGSDGRSPDLARVPPEQYAALGRALEEEWWRVLGAAAAGAFRAALAAR